ncbi:MAG TPA: hypothetical protein VGO33_13480 [Gemmatimonadaceae bacterium]|nr:hypothetical protein [Gemmatimonadaceae bacterium]
MGASTKCAARCFVLLVAALGLVGTNPQRIIAQIPLSDTTCKVELLKMRAEMSASDSALARADLSRCDRMADSINRERRLRQTRPEALRLATMFFDIPEYHDEGRLPKDHQAPGAELGPLAGIYASPFLGGFTRPAQIYEQGVPGTLAALVVVDPQPGEAIPPSYSRLQLQAGVNCIWLYVDPPATGASGANYLAHLHYTARVSHSGDDKPCDRTAAMATPLSVVAVLSDHFSHDADVPAVARFDTDAAGVPIISFRCLNSFCEVGVTTESNVRTPDRLKRPHQAQAKWDPAHGGDRKIIVKGWHDEQALAVRGTDWIWRASEIRALIRPNPKAADYDAAKFAGQWQTVGTIEIFDPVPRTNKYHDWGLRKGNNVVQFTYDPPGTHWKVQIKTDSGTVVPWYFIERTVHHDLTVPAVARFRWTVADDGIWAPCGNACCKASGQQ